MKINVNMYAAHMMEQQMKVDINKMSFLLLKFVLW